MKCAGCGRDRESKNDRLPRGWHRRGEEPVCPECWGQAYMLRAVTIPVASPLSMDWPAFREILNRIWSDSTRLANWAMRRLWLADRERSPEDEKLWPAPRLYLYPEARALIPRMDTSSVVSLLQAVERRWRRARLETLWRSAASLPTYRYPMPYPVHNQAWSARIAEGGELILEARLGGGRIELRLRGGYQFRRQRRAIERLIAGEAHKGELAIYRQRASSGDHRTVIEGRGPGGAPRVPHSVMTKLVLWLPREHAPTENGKIMVLRTALDRFLVADIEDREEAWSYNADHARRWIGEHRRRMQRLSEDAKAERRAGKRPRREEDRRAQQSEKFRRRMRSFRQETATMIAKLARRSGVAAVVLDFSIKDYFPSFPWFEFEDYLETKLDEYGIRCTQSENAKSADAEPQSDGAIVAGSVS